MPPEQNSRQAFTLVELMIALALSMFLLSALLSLTFGVFRMMLRAAERVDLHQRARHVYDVLGDAFSATVNTSAMVAITLPSDRSSPAALIAQPGQITLVFLAGSLKDTDWMLGRADGPTKQLAMDVTWDYLTWNRSSQSLQLGRSNKVTRFVNDDTGFVSNDGSGPTVGWFYPGGSNPYAGQGGYGLGIVVTPRRTFTTVNSSQAPTTQIANFWNELDDNRWWYLHSATPSASATQVDVVDKMHLNRGDAGSMQDSASSLMEGVQDLTIQLVCGDSTKTFTATDTATAFQLYNGLYVDGTSTLAEVQARPRLIRLQFTLVGTKTDVSQTFTFSFPVSAYDLAN